MDTRGSIARKWDLHVHSPASYSHQFTLTEDDRRVFGNDVWEKYISELEKVEDIAVIAITDYFTIDGYRKIREYRRGNRLQNFAQILPNIEFRLDTLVNGKRLNYHVIFSEELDPDTIENEFLSSLDILTPSGEKRSLSRENIEKVGQTLKDQGGFQDDSDYAAGCKTIFVSIKDIVDTLCTKPTLFEGKYLLVLADRDWANMRWETQAHLLKQIPLNQSDALFSSNEKTIRWALGKGGMSEAEFTKAFGSLKPCIHGSDAHSFDRLCKPDLDRFCWIKADTTFEGLKQIIYEPADRVYIGPENPEHRKNIYTLDSVTIEEKVVNTDLTMSRAVIPLNSNLITVVGGKGTGKTALLDLIANCFQDRCCRQIEEKRDRTSFVQRIEEQAGDLVVELAFQGDEIGPFSKRLKDTEVFGDVRITYLPQGKIEQYSGDRKRLDDKVEEIIFGSTEASNYKKQFADIGVQVTDLANSITTINAGIVNFEQQTTAEIMAKVEQDTNIKKGELRDAKARQEELEEKLPASSTERINTLKKEESQVENKSSKLASLKTELEEFQQELLKIQASLNMTIDKLNEKMSEFKFPKAIPHLDIEPQLNAIKEASSFTASLVRESQTDMRIVEIKEELAKLEGDAKEQSDLLGDIKNIQGEIESLEKEEAHLDSMKTRIQELAKERLDEYIKMLLKYFEQKQHYKKVIDAFSSSQTSILGGISFKSSIHFDENLFVFCGSEILNLRSVSKSDIGRLASMLKEIIGNDDTSRLPEKTKDFAKNALSYKKYLIKSRGTTDLYNWVFNNYFKLTTQIFFNEIPMHILSMGQKGTVLLKLFLSEGNYPLIIDQPEENLDNKFIYDELVDAFRDAKKKRQVIIATNNANLVVNADAEQIITANFESGTISYKTGTLEDPSTKKEITDILEGGPEAFKRREQKYGI